MYVSLNHFLSRKSSLSCYYFSMDFETGSIPEVEVGWGLFSFLYPLIFGMVSLLGLLVSDFDLSSVKLPVFRWFDKMLSLVLRQL